MLDLPAGTPTLLLPVLTAFLWLPLIPVAYWIRKRRISAEAIVGWIVADFLALLVAIFIMANSWLD